MVESSLPELPGSAARPTAMARALMTLVRGYELGIRPVLGPRCRFLPTCSEYAREALATHGAARGTWLTARRLCRCHPFHPGGLDLVPPRPDPSCKPNG